MVLYEIEEGGVSKTVPKRERTSAPADVRVRIEFARIAPNAVGVYTLELGGEAGGA